ALSKTQDLGVGLDETIQSPDRLAERPHCAGRIFRIILKVAEVDEAGSHAILVVDAIWMVLDQLAIDRQGRLIGSERVWLRADRLDDRPDAKRGAGHLGLERRLAAMLLEQTSIVIQCGLQ